MIEAPPCGGPTGQDGTDPKLAAWLQAKIDESLVEDPLTPPADPLATDDEAPTHPGTKPRVQGPSAWGARDEDTTDPETVLADWSRIRDDAADEDDDDPETVRLARMPVSFIGESVMDDDTVTDVRQHAVDWREAIERSQAVTPNLPPRIPQPAPVAGPPTEVEDDTAERGLTRIAWALAAAVLVAVVLAGGALLAIAQGQ